MEIVPDSSYVYEVVLVQSWPPTPCNHCQHISAFLLTKKRKKRKKEKKFIQQTLCCSRFKWTTESWPMNLQKGKKKRQVSIKKKKKHHSYWTWFILFQTHLEIRNQPFCIRNMVTTCLPPSTSGCLCYLILADHGCWSPKPAQFIYNYVCLCLLLKR